MDLNKKKRGELHSSCGMQCVRNPWLCDSLKTQTKKGECDAFFRNDSHDEGKKIVS